MFLPDYYRQYPDLARLSDTECWDHYQQWGHRERRRFNPNICLESYLCRYLDLRAAFGKNHLDAFSHYQTYGIKEGRIATPIANANVLTHFWTNKGYGLVDPQRTLRRVCLDESARTGKGVSVGMIDTGFNSTDAIAHNTREVRDGMDNDRNGLIDDLAGWDFYDADNDVTDEHGHGTIVGEVLRASAPDCKIAVVKANGANGLGRTEALSTGIRYLCDRGVRAINISQSTTASTPELESAVNYALQKKVILVCSGGNNGVLEFPAVLGVRFPNIIAVGGCDSSGQIWQSGWRSAIALPSPCSLNFVTDYAEYKGWSGTSISAPRVTGLIARMLEVIPLLGMEAIIDCLIRECR